MEKNTESISRAHNIPPCPKEYSKVCKEQGKMCRTKIFVPTKSRNATATNNLEYAGFELVAPKYSEHYLRLKEEQVLGYKCFDYTASQKAFVKQHKQELKEFVERARASRGL
jgi:hypothetical protein